MVNNLPQQLKKAVELFKEFENSRVHSQKVKHFQAAIDIIESYLSENPDSPYKEFLLHQKKAYTRVLLQDISEGSGLPNPQVEWWNYLLILVRCEKEAKIIVGENFKLKESYDNFWVMWGDDALRVAEYAEQARRSKCV